MESSLYTFEQLPTLVADLGRKVDDLTALVQLKIEQNSPVIDRWFSIEELCEYLPDRPARTTVYGKVQQRQIPFSRKGKRLIFRKSEIDLWLQSGRVKTDAEIAIAAEQHPIRRRKNG